MNKLSKIFAICLLSSGGWICSCSSSESAIIRPTPAQDNHASFDGNVDDSGLIEMSNGVALVSSYFVERYNAMVRVYGSEPEFVPAIKEGDGVSPAPVEQSLEHPGRGALFLMTPQALVRFIKMNQWRKMGRIPSASKPRPGIISRVIESAIS